MLNSLIKAIIVPLVLLFLPSDKANAQLEKYQASDNLTTPQISIIDIPKNDTSYVSILKPPTSKKLRSGFVSLLPGRSGEEHSTVGYEEMIVILDGQAVLHSGDKDKAFCAGQVAYVPPHTKHFVRNIGESTLRYLYIVTKVE